MQRLLSALFVYTFLVVSILFAPHLAQAESCENICAAAMEPGQVQNEDQGQAVTCCCLGDSAPYTTHAPEDCATS